jgi:hypothetical protein
MRGALKTVLVEYAAAAVVSIVFGVVLYMVFIYRP